MNNYAETYAHPVQRVRKAINRGQDPRMVVREDLTLSAVDGIYNQLLFDLCASNVVVGLTLMGAYEPLLDVIGWETSAVNRIVEHFITYVAPDGTYAENPTSSLLSDPCALGNSVESGGCSFVLQGWGRLRRCSEPRDLTDMEEKYCERQPTYNIAGQTIDDDSEWDMVRLMTVILQDLQREIIVGNSSVAGSQNGFEQLVDYGYVDPLTGEACPAMDSIVVDWGGQEMCPDEGASDVTVNGVAITDGYSLLGIIKDFIYLNNNRVANSTLSGVPRMILTLPSDFVRCLIDCYVCEIICENDVERMDAFEVRQMHADLRNQFGAGRMVILPFDGYPILVIPFDFGLYDTDNNVGDMYLFTTDIGNTPVTRLQAKDMNNIVSNRAASDTGHGFTVTDDGRVLEWHSFDQTCFTRCVELQWRLLLRAPWSAMRIMDVACTAGGAFGVIRNFADPTAANFANAALTAPYPVIPNLPPVVTNPGAQSDTEEDVISLQIVATEPESESMTYVAAGLPDGLTIDADTGEISGTIDTDAAGVYAVMVTVSDQNGNSTVIAFPWTVVAN